jgi:hypothetical protein
LPAFANANDLAHPDRQDHGLQTTQVGLTANGASQGLDPGALGDEPVDGMCLSSLSRLTAMRATVVLLRQRCRRGARRSRSARRDLAQVVTLWETHRHTFGAPLLSDRPRPVSPFYDRANRTQSAPVFASSPAHTGGRAELAPTRRRVVGNDQVSICGRTGQPFR